MQNTDRNTTMKKQLANINRFIDNGNPISLKEMRKTLLMIGMDSKISEKGSIVNVAKLDVRHNCHDVLQFGYRTICKEATYTLDKPTNENFIIIVGQYITLKTLEEYLRHERVLEQEELDALSTRTIETIGKSAKVFKRINNISKR